MCMSKTSALVYANMRSGNCLIILNLFFFFWMWVIFKVFMESVTTLLLFYVLFFWPWSMWHLSRLTRESNPQPLLWKQSLKHWITMDTCKMSSLPNTFPQIILWEALLLSVWAAEYNSVLRWGRDQNAIKIYL